MIVKAVKGGGITGAVRYITGETKGVAGTAQESRVAWLGGAGFGFEIDSAGRVETARRVMEFAAQHQTGRTKKCSKDALHLMLSWAPDEQPGRAEMEEAAGSVLASLGMGHARFVMAAHRDTGNPHLHIVASRIDPQTGKAFRDSYDKAALSQWARAWEAAHGGIRCQRRQGKAPPQRRKDAALEVQALPVPVGPETPAAVAAVTDAPIGGATEQPEPAAPSLPALAEDISEREDERAMLAAAAAPYREQMARDGTLEQNIAPAWWQMAVAFAVYIQEQLWQWYNQVRGNEEEVQNRSL